jgi:hypothetical protein
MGSLPGTLKADAQGFAPTGEQEKANCFSAESPAVDGASSAAWSPMV